MRIIESPMGALVDTSEGTRINFCSNDYLGLANHLEIKKALADAAQKWGTGAAASRLVSGNTRAHVKLEQEMAEFMEAETAVLFPSGYQANVGALSSLTESGDVIFSDQLVHASIIDGARLSRAKVHIFRHLDMEHLDALLQREKTKGLNLIVTDAIFSMDGDKANLPKLAEVAEKHNAVLYVDEAHALGVVGRQGRGLTAEYNLTNRVTIRIGTFGKAFGATGAVVACPETAAALIRSGARSLLYTTAMPPPLAETLLKSMEVVRHSDDLRARLMRNVALFRAHAKQSRLPVLESSTPIQPILVGSAGRAVNVSERLFERGFFIQGIRPPTVPEGMSRLRVVLTAHHQKEQITRLVEAISATLAEIKS
jgi:8-amino-7-oxononanoate synthase